MTRPTPGQQRVPYVRRCELSTGDQTLEGLICNISVLGAYVSLETIPSIGSVFELRFGLPESEKPVVVEAQVTWDNPLQDNPLHGLPPGCGVRFLDLSPVDKRRIHRVIDGYVPPIR
jgi:uncharacterized protein (TIGR02266 family)